MRICYNVVIITMFLVFSVGVVNAKSDWEVDEALNSAKLSKAALCNRSMITPYFNYQPSVDNVTEGLREKKENYQNAVCFMSDAFLEDASRLIRDGKLSNSKKESIIDSLERIGELRSERINYAKNFLGLQNPQQDLLVKVLEVWNLNSIAVRYGVNGHFRSHYYLIINEIVRNEKLMDELSVPFMELHNAVPFVE